MQGLWISLRIGLTCCFIPSLAENRKCLSGFFRFTVGNPGGWTSIEEVSADGGRPHALFPGWNGVYCCGNWTPGGEYYVFQSTFNWRTDIWALRERTGLLWRGNNEPVQLTAGPMDFRSPVPSLDGKRLFVIGEQRRGELV